MAEHAEGARIIAIPRDKITEKEIIPIRDGQVTFTPLHRKDAHSYVDFIKKHKTSHERSDIEDDPSLQQIATYAAFVDNDSVLVVRKGHGDPRLEKSVSIGFGGHFDDTDPSLVHSFFRELGEEVSVVKDGETVDLGEGYPMRKMQEYMDVMPAGIIKDERDDVGRAHIGVVAVITPKTEGITFAPKPETGNTPIAEYMKIQDLSDKARSGEIELAGWGQVVLDEVLLPRVNQNLNA